MVPVISVAVIMWLVLGVGLYLRVKENQRRRETTDTYQILLGRWFLLPSILVGIVAYVLPLSAFVQGVTLLENANPALADQLPQWVIVTLSILLVVAFFGVVLFTRYVLPWLCARHALILTPIAIELRNRFTRRSLARIDLEADFTTEIRHYTRRSTDIHGVRSSYTHFEEIRLVQGNNELTVQKELQTDQQPRDKLPFRWTAYRIASKKDHALFDEHRKKA